jgi:prepilin-type N-terminal cleavage/methylation domain-containing protein
MRRRARAAGFTLVETMIALALLGLVVVQVTMVFSSASKDTVKTAGVMNLEAQARRVLSLVAYAVMSADRAALFPDPESPNFSDEITYMVSIGVDEGGEVVWSDPESVGLNMTTQVLWRQNPGEPEERRVAWCNAVRPFLEGELKNGVDDNGNGLIDERGLSFTLQEDLVTIRLSLGRSGKEGETVVDVETAVTVRN